jgi:hypothetical protein
VQRGRLERSVTWQEPIEELSERFTVRKATVEVHAKETHADSGCSSSISKDVDDFIQLFYKEDPYLIDTAQDGVMMKTHFYGTTRTWAGGDRGEKLLLIARKRTCFGCRRLRAICCRSAR